MKQIIILAFVSFCVFVAGRADAQSITRTKFTPTVVPESYVQPVRFEATFSSTPASGAVFNYNSVARTMYDDGTNGDVTAGDNVWTILLTANDVLSKNTAVRVFRTFLGTCQAVGGSAFNVVAECWTSAIGLTQVRAIDATAQETDYIANYVGTAAQITSFNPAVWAQRFYQTHGDKYDFLNMIRIAGAVGNRNHFGVKNTVSGIGESIINNTASYGSAGRLQGITNYPLSGFFDGGETGFAHETGHQWINFLSGTAYAGGTPHWPKGNIAINVMGFSIGGTGGAGGTYGFTFTSNGSGGYLVGSNVAINQSTFNPMELYLMGLATPAEVPDYFVLNDQNQNVSVGQTLSASEITTASINDVIAAKGSRVPDSTASQKTFRCATLVVSEQLLDGYAMAFYDYFARRCEARNQLTYAQGLATGTTNPWYLATSRRSVMFSKIADDIPQVTAARQVNGDATLSLTTKLGISYQRQSSSNLTTWTDEDAAIAPGDTHTDVTIHSPGVGPKFWRYKVIY